MKNTPELKNSNLDEIDKLNAEIATVKLSLLPGHLKKIWALIAKEYADVLPKGSDQ